MELRNTDISIAKKPRQSNMELLRIIAMLLVMVVHANFRALPVPTAMEIEAEPVSKLLMFFVEAISVIAVDLFIILSGWFGIRPKVTRLTELLFQVLFFGLFAIGVCAVFAPERLQTTAFYGSTMSRLFMCGENDYWFVKAYVGLYLMSPVLNAYVEHSSQRQFALFLIAFYIFQSVYGWLFNATKWIESGYSMTSFAGLYMLARYMRLYPIKLWQRSKWFDAAVYGIYVIVLTISMFYIKKSGLKGGILYFYTCPFVIIAAMHFVLFFTKLRPFSSKIINWLGISAFSIYLTHSSSFIGYYYDMWIYQWFENDTRIVFITHTVLLIIVVFVASIIIDKLRIALWNSIMKKIKNNKKNIKI